MNKYEERLYKEWSQHGKIIIGLDFDSTIYPWHTIDNKEDMEKVINLIKYCRNYGTIVIINSCSNVDRYEEIQNYCKSIGIEIDAINKTPDNVPYGKTGKIYANIYLDDRAGLNESISILTTVVNKISFERNQISYQSWK